MKLELRYIHPDRRTAGYYKIYVNLDYKGKMIKQYNEDKTEFKYCFTPWRNTEVDQIIGNNYEDIKTKIYNYYKTIL
jgi:hypothetical protein